jgi:acyl-coenzyme A synthetase/AMP-(fatty) acid ligase
VNAAEYLLGSEALAKHGARVALICGEEAVTYIELAERVRRSAAAFSAAGVRPGDRVLLLMRDTPEFAAAWLGAVRAGAVVVSLNSRLTDAEYRHIRTESAARVLLIEEGIASARADLAREFSGGGRMLVAGASVRGPDAWRELLAGALDAPAFDAPPQHPAFCLYSSGTTGRPKGILHAHKDVRPVGQAFRAFGIGADDRVFTTSKFFFAYGLEHALLGPLALGATSVLFPDWPDAEAMVKTARAHGPTALFSVPTLFRRLLALPAEQLQPFRAVRRFAAGGEPMSPQLAAQWKRAVGGEILNVYGTSESFCACMVTRPGTSDGTRTGTPLPDLEARLLDAQGEAVKPGEPGVLWLRHPSLALGYVDLPEQTKAQFREGWFCTRDIFVRDAQGSFLYQGRSDELIKIAGQWVRPAELEEIVASAAGIVEAACVAVPDGDGLERLALFIAVEGDAASALQAAAEACERALPRHKRPKWLRAVQQLPRTASGKLQRFKLREILARERSSEG